MSSVANPQRLIVLLAALVAFGPLSIDMYLPGLPLIAQDLQAPESSIQLTISAFLAGLFVGMLFYGPLSDKYGRRRLLLGGIILYLTASIGCMLASSAEWLIAARFLQALGAAAASVLARAICARPFFSERSRPRTLADAHCNYDCDPDCTADRRLSDHDIQLALSVCGVVCLCRAGSAGQRLENP